jgi:hypothetical protein
MNKKIKIIIFSVLMFALLIETIRYISFKNEWIEKQKKFELQVSFKGDGKEVEQSILKNIYVKKNVILNLTSISLSVSGNIDNIDNYEKFKSEIKKQKAVTGVSLARGGYVVSPTDLNTHCFYLCLVKIYD